MNRVEIISNVALEEDLFEMMRAAQVGKHYSKLNSVHGEGYTDPKMGDAIWPEENIILIIYCEDDELSSLKTIVTNLRKGHSDSGIRMFILPGVEEI